MNFCARILFVFLLTCFFSDLSRAEHPAKIPPPLTPWVEWVLHGHEAELLCPPSFNDSSTLHCDWPSQLDLNVTESAGSFRQQWLVQDERWLQLPGDTEHWPVDVKVNEQAALVMNREGVPKIRMKSGACEITGRFQWSALPEYLTIPPHTGLVSLAVNKRQIDFPNLDRNSRLWLQSSKTQTEKIENSLNVQAFRLIEDTIPAQLTTLLKLDIGGVAREVVLGPAFSPEQAIPLALTSDLPARLEPDGRIRAQVRPENGRSSLSPDRLARLPPIAGTGLMTRSGPRKRFSPSRRILICAPSRSPGWPRLTRRKPPCLKNGEAFPLTGCLPVRPCNSRRRDAAPPSLLLTS